MKNSEIKRLYYLTQGNVNGYDGKTEFKSLATKFLRAVDKTLGLGADIRYNKGGAAVSGDAILHGDGVYVSFNADFNLGILVRACKGRKDYTGGTNTWFRFEGLNGNDPLGAFCTHVRDVATRRTAVSATPVAWCREAETATTICW